MCDATHMQVEGGDMVWRRHGQIHRDDGPAIIRADGTQEWYRDGRRHRDDGPSLIFHTGAEAWCRHGQIHRDGGPAVIYANGHVEWFINGRPFPAEFGAWIEEMGLPPASQWTDREWVLVELRWGDGG